jgi:O-antigen ligase
VLLVAGLCIGMFLLISTGSRYSLNVSQESSAASRPVLWGTAYLIIQDNPLLGIGRDRYKEVSVEYATKLPDSLRDEAYVSRALGRFSPHQDFLNVWVSFGAVAFFFYCGVFVLVASAFVRAYRLHAGDPLLQAVSAGALAALVAYAVNSSFHNLLDVTWSFWFLSGLAAVLIGLAALRKEPRAW